MKSEILKPETLKPETLKPEILGVRFLHEGWSRFGLVRVRLADGTEATRELEDHGDSVGEDVLDLINLELPVIAHERPRWIQGRS